MSRLKIVWASVLGASLASAALAAEGPVPFGIPRLDHVFVIMMENHGFQQIAGNPAMPFVNGLIANKQVSLATNYFAVGHPSLTNYLEIVGGSNFGVRTDDSPDWHDRNCTPNIVAGIGITDSAPPTNLSSIYNPNYDNGAVCPIAGVGMDSPTEPVDTWNETNAPIFNYLANIDGVLGYAAAPTVGMTIADQLALNGRSWKTYQESLPVSGADLIDTSNGTSTNLTTFNANQPLSANNLPPLTSAAVVAAYAVKHNPFAYFASVQQGSIPGSSLANVVGLEGGNGLYADLASGNVPTLSFIVPNQCDDQHGRSNGDAYCNYDQGIPITVGGTTVTGNTDGTQAGMNPGLSEQADVTVQHVVTSITSSPVWNQGYNAIVIVWDENDYSGIPTALPAGTPFPTANQNTVVLTVQTNHGRMGVQSNRFYTSFSLLKSLESGLGLPCLNHACDPNVAVMEDLFGFRGY